MGEMTLWQQAAWVFGSMLAGWNLHALFAARLESKALRRGAEERRKASMLPFENLLDEMNERGEG